MTGPNRNPRDAGDPPGDGRRTGWAGRSRDAERPGTPDGHAEEVLSQALRALAGGSRQSRLPAPETRRPGHVPFTPLQVVLLAVLLGLLIGMTAGVVSLLV